MAVTQEEKRLIARDGFAYTSTLDRQRYWTPDGREVYSIPSMHGFVRRDAQGKILQQGMRDANLDKGWLMSPPVDPKHYCPHCDKWHDDQEGVDACGKSRRKFQAKWNKQTKKDRGNGDEIAEMRKEMGELKAMFAQLMQHGSVLQPSGNGDETDTEEPGSTEEGV